MRAIEVAALGGTDQLELVNLPDPTPGPGEILIDIEACGLNYADVMMRRGLYVGGPPPRFIPGLEVAGTVAAVGDSVTKVVPGQKVMALVSHGGYAEKVVAPSTSVMARPEGMSAEAAAAFPVNYFTADFALHFAGNIQPGQTVLIHAAAGGVGTAAVQLAKIAGARVIATASTAGKLERVKALGADVCIDYTKDDFLAVVKDVTDGKGVELVLESVGGDVFDKSMSALRTLGRLIVFGIASADARRPDVRDMLFRNLWVIGLHLGALMANPDVAKASAERLFGLLATGRIVPQVGHVLKLEEAARAQDLLGDRGNYGKVVIKP
ncbi:MAG: NADPH:quinone oxidoreductase family protein [Blastocatellia bacterium]|jgi:NADPH2:quinone reductase|nr:NADPH:quinone oxidoreductase family protein [Blastocatellia bacterium]